MTSQPTITPDLAEAGRALQEVLAPKETDMSELQEVPQTDIRPESKSVIKRRYRRKTNVQRVLDVLKDGNARDTEAIAKQAGLENQQVHGTTWLLCKEGTITRIGHGTYILTKALKQQATDSVPEPVQDTVPGVVPEPEPQPELADQAQDDVVGLVAFLTQRFGLDPEDVELAIRYYNRFETKGL